MCVCGGGVLLIDQKQGYVFKVIMKTPGRDNFSGIYTPLSKSMVYRHDTLLVNWKNDKDPIMITCKSFRNIKIKKKN